MKDIQLSVCRRHARTTVCSAGDADAQFLIDLPGQRVLHVWEGGGYVPQRTTVVLTPAALPPTVRGAIALRG